MGSFARLTWVATMAGVVATVAGIIVLVAYSFSEALANPGYSLEDGYWLGREPWISIGVVLVVVAATVVAVVGTVSAFIGRRWVGLVSLLPLAVVGFFWFVAIYWRAGGAPCESCPPPTIDPFAYAYSLPSSTMVLLLLPAVVIAALAFATRPRHREPGETPAVLTA